MPKLFMSLALLMTLLTPSLAWADVTAFIGFNPTPTTRPVRGFAGGIGLVIVAFEFEYANTSEDLQELAPGLKTYMVNGLLQTPIPIAGMQFYATAGGGVFTGVLRRAQRDELRHQRRRRREGQPRWAATFATGLPDFYAAGIATARAAAAVLRGIEPEVLKKLVPGAECLVHLAPST